MQHEKLTRAGKRRKKLRQKNRKDRMKFKGAGNGQRRDSRLIKSFRKERDKRYQEGYGEETGITTRH